MITAPLPIDAARRTAVSSIGQSFSVCGDPSRLVARGLRSLMKITPWPTKTSSSIVTPLQMKLWLEILQRRPIRALRWTWTPGPSRTSSATHAYRPDSSRCIAAPLFHRAVDRDRTSLLAEGQARSFEHAHYL